MAEENVTGTAERVDSVDASKILCSSTGASQSNTEVRKETTADSYSTMSMIFGILSVVGQFTGIISLGFAIAGLVFASKAKKLGLDDTMRKVGFWTSLAGVVMASFVTLFLIGIILVYGLSIFGTILMILIAALASAKEIFLVL